MTKHHSSTEHVDLLLARKNFQGFRLVETLLLRRATPPDMDGVVEKFALPTTEIREHPIKQRTEMVGEAVIRLARDEFGSPLVHYVHEAVQKKKLEVVAVVEREQPDGSLNRRTAVQADISDSLHNAAATRELPDGYLWVDATSVIDLSVRGMIVSAQSGIVEGYTEEKHRYIQP